MVRKWFASLFDPGAGRKKSVRFRTACVTTLHSWLCCASLSARAPAVAQTYTGVSAMSALGTRVAISSSIGPIASATSSADLPAKDARGVSSLTRAPAGSSVNVDA